MEMEIEMETHLRASGDSIPIILNIYIYPGVSSIIALVSVHLHLRVPLSFPLPFAMCCRLSAMITQIATVSIFRLSPFTWLIGSVGVLPTITGQLPYAISPNCV